MFIGVIYSNRTKGGHLDRHRPLGPVLRDFVTTIRPSFFGLVVILRKTKRQERKGKNRKERKVRVERKEQQGKNRKENRKVRTEKRERVLKKGRR